MSDTPETDAEKFFSDHHGYCVVFAEHAEDLERERDKYQEQADALLIRLGATQERMIDAERELAAIRAIFPKILGSLKSGFCSETCSIDFLNEIPKEVRLVKERLERERDAAQKAMGDARDVLLDAMPDANAPTKILAEMIVAERDLWRAEAERWRDCEKP